jgi:hypothetical protein
MNILLHFKRHFENLTVNLNALCNSCAKIASCSSELIFTFLYAGSRIQNANEKFVSRIQLSFVNFALHKTPQKIHRSYVCRFKQLHLGNHSQLDTCSHEVSSGNYNDRHYHFPKY